MKNSINGGRGTVRRYYLFEFLSSFSFFSAVLIPFYTQWGHITLGQSQMIQAWFMLWIFILEVPTGVVADRFGRKNSIALGALIIGFATLVYGSFPHLGIFLLGEFLFATGVALISGANNALLYDALKENGQEKESKHIFSQAHAIHLLAMFISAPIGSLFAFRFGLNFPMLLTSIPYLIAAVVAWSIREPKIQGKISESRRYLDIAWNGFNYFRRHNALRLLAFDAILVAAGAYFVIWFYQPLLIELNIPIVYFGYIHALLISVEMFVSADFTRLEKMFGSGTAYFKFSALVTSLSMVLVAVFPNIFTVLLLILFAGGFGLTRLELMSAYMNRFIPSSHRATVLSSISMFRRLSLVLLNPLIGYLADHSLSAALLIVSVLPMSVLLFSPLREKIIE